MTENTGVTSLSDEDLAAWLEQAKRDDWHLRFVGSDIRLLIGEIQRLRASSPNHADTGLVERAICENCLGAQWVCENHLDRPWGGMIAAPTACECGAGQPCPVCNREMANAPLHHRIADLEAALERAIGLVEDAEKDTNWVSGDPYGDSATVELRSILSGAAKITVSDATLKAEAIQLRDVVRQATDALQDLGWPDQANEFRRMAEAPTTPINDATAALASIPDLERMDVMREALASVVDAMRDWIVPDGISADEFAERAVAALDNPKINPILKELDDGRS